MDPLLRREVELPPRAHQRAPFYLGLASLLVSLLILLDAALCSHPPARPSAREPAATRARAHAAARLSRTPCPDRARRRAAAAPAPAPLPLDPHRAEFRRQAAEQLARPWAAADDGPATVVNGMRYSQPAPVAR